MNTLQRMILVGLFATTTISARAAQYFVSPTGDDAAAGSSAAPWRTLQHAANVVGAGDRVTVRAGDYVGFYLDSSGLLGAPIEFVAEPGVVISQRNAVTPDGINLESASYVTIDGFTVGGMPRAGVRTVGRSSQPAQWVTVRHVYATNNGSWGIFTAFVDDLLIDSNTASGSIREHGIYVSNSGDRPVVRGNHIFGNRAAGIHVNGDLSEGGDGIISGALVSGNRIHDNGLGGGSGINMDGVRNSRIENNLLYNNHASGISLYRIDGGAPSTGNIVVNNTINNASNGRWALNVQDASAGNTVVNNILLNENTARGAINISPDSLSGFLSDYNVVIPRFTTNDANTILSLAQWQAQTGNDVHSLVGDATNLFINPAGGDFHLRATALAIDRGTSQFAPAADLDGRSRPLGNSFDVGAYEYVPEVLTGDYNRNGVVDASDYVVWRNTLGDMVPSYSGADGDGDGTIGPADFNLWRSNFGRAGAEALSIPEPRLGVSLWAAVTSGFAAFVGRCIGRPIAVR